MKNGSDSQLNLDFVCFRCGCIIKTGERMISMSVSLETPTKDDTVEHIESTAVSTICFACASLLLSQAIVANERLVMPPEREVQEEVEEQEDNEETIVSTNEEKDMGAKLGVRSSRKGFDFVLDCGDGISKSTSRLFTWKQIVQMLVAADPDMFGTLEEPLHHVFQEALERFGLRVPNWHNL